MAPCNNDPNCSKVPYQRELDKIFLKISKIMSPEELGGRRRKVYYRNRLLRSREDLLLGLPGTPMQTWNLIDPTPRTEDSAREFSEELLGLMRTGDIAMIADRLAVTRQELETSEFYIDDNPDAPAPQANTSANYDIIEGSVIEGGTGARGLYRSFWICGLRKRQHA